MYDADVSAAANDIDRLVGARIRALRVEKRLTLESLADLSGVSRAMLSRIERAESSPTAQLLNKLCGGLSVSISALFAHAEAPVNPLSRRSDQPTWRDPETGYLRRNVSAAAAGSAVDIVEVEFPPGRSITFDSARFVGWDQHVWVLDGALRLDLGGEVHDLRTGDCLMMSFDRPITFHNPTQHPVRYAVIVSHGTAGP